MKNHRNVVAAALMCIIAMIVASCGHRDAKKTVSDPDIISQNKGKVIVALLGMPGCPGTQQATAFLTDFSTTKPAGVVLYRVDVPLEGKPLQKAANVSSNINYLVDTHRTTANQFEFFFYPTLYIVDRDGVVRFTGACEPEKVKAMVSELLAEKPGGEKKMYTQPLIKVGEVIPDFRISDVNNKKTSLGAHCASNGAILFFSATTCPFSVGALSDLETLKKDFKSSKFKYVIVSLGEDAKTVKDVYSGKSPGSIVLIDADKSVSAKYFGVSAVPFFYVLNKNRMVVDRRPFVYGTAKAAIAKALGVSGGSGTGCAEGAG
jgi:peroxiredoxin